MSTKASDALQGIEQQLTRDIEDTAALAAHLQALLASPALTQHLNGIAASGLAGRIRHARKIGDGRIVLLESERFVLHLHMVKSSAPYLTSVGSDALIAIRSRAPVAIDRYSFAPSSRIEVFEPGAPLKLTGTTLHDGAVLHERVCEHLIRDYRCEKPFAKLILTFRPGAEQIWFFDRNTQSALFATLGATDHSACIMLAKMLAALEEQRALPLILELTQHPSHAVRWSAIQALGRLDGAKALATLEQAASDPHPHIRASAVKTLRRILSSNSR